MTARLRPQKDPAIEAWAAMRENTTRYFRLTPRLALQAAIALVGVPAAIYYAGMVGQAWQRASDGPAPGAADRPGH